MLVGALLIILVVAALLTKTYLEKRRIEQARLLVDLQDSLRRMQNASSAFPEVYLDKPTKVFIYKRLIQLSQAIAEVDQAEAAGMGAMETDFSSKMEAARNTPDDSVKRLSKWASIPHPDTAHELRRLVQFLHQEVIDSTKSGLIPKAHAKRVIKNLKITASRIPLDLNFSIAKGAFKTKQYRQALGKLRVAQGVIKRSPVRQYLKKQAGQIEELMKKTDEALAIAAEKNKAKTANSLAAGMDKMAEDEQWEQKKNYFDD